MTDWAGPREKVASIARWERHGQVWEAFLADGVAPEAALREMLAQGGTLRLFRLSSPSLHEVFLRVVREGDRDGR